MTITTWLVFFGFCIVATISHELGHYVAACAVGLTPDKFIVGLTGKPIYKRGKLQITAIPVSGAVYFEGDRFLEAPIKSQKIIALGGPISSLIVGLISFPFLPLFSLINFLAFFGNLIPITVKNQKTDGAFVTQDLIKFFTVPLGLVLGTITLIIFYQIFLFLL